MSGEHGILCTGHFIQQLIVIDHLNVYVYECSFLCIYCIICIVLVCMYIICMHVCMHVCMYIYVCMNECFCMYIYVLYYKYKSAMYVCVTDHGQVFKKLICNALSHSLKDIVLELRIVFSLFIV